MGKDDQRKNAEPSRDRSGYPFLLFRPLAEVKKIGTHSTIQMNTIAKMFLLLKNEIGNFIFCTQRILDK